MSYLLGFLDLRGLGNLFPRATFFPSRLPDLGGADRLPWSVEGKVSAVSNVHGASNLKL